MSLTLKESLELLSKYVDIPNQRPWILTQPDTDKDALQRAGHSSVEEMEEAGEDALRLRADAHRDQLANEAREKELRYIDIAKVKAELDVCLSFQLTKGGRVRAVIRDRKAGRRVCDEFNANSRRIIKLKTLIKSVEE